MKFSNSPLVVYIKISPNKNPRNTSIKKITIHHMAGNLSVETCGNVFAPSSRQASSNYGVDSNGRVGMYVEEKDRSWCSSNAENDNQAVTIEVANDVRGGDWHVSDKALEATIELCVDICKRNGIKKLIYTGDKKGNLTRHDFFKNKVCPGPYLGSKFPYIAEEVNKRLSGEISNENGSDKKHIITDPKKVDYRRIQVFSSKNIEDAKKERSKCNDKGLDTRLILFGGFYKVQVIVYGDLSKAERALKEVKKYYPKAFISFEVGEKVEEEVKIGCKVKVRKGALTYNDEKPKDFVFSTIYTVRDIKNDRVVLGEINTPFRKKDLIILK